MINYTSVNREDSCVIFIVIYYADYHQFNLLKNLLLKLLLLAGKCKCFTIALVV